METRLYLAANDFEVYSWRATRPQTCNNSTKRQSTRNKSTPQVTIQEYCTVQVWCTCVSLDGASTLAIACRSHQQCTITRAEPQTRWGPCAGGSICVAERRGIKQKLCFVDCCFRPTTAQSGILAGRGKSRLAVAGWPPSCASPPSCSALRRSTSSCPGPLAAFSSRYFIYWFEHGTGPPCRC